MIVPVGYDVPVNRYETALFLVFATFGVALFGLYHFMIYAVNKRLPTSDRIPHVRISRGGLWLSHGFEWNRVRNDYKRLYPSSFINQVMVGCIGPMAVVAIALVALRDWEYTHGRLP